MHAPTQGDPIPRPAIHGGDNNLIGPLPLDPVVPKVPEDWLRLAQITVPRCNRPSPHPFGFSQEVHLDDAQGRTPQDDRSGGELATPNPELPRLLTAAGHGDEEAWRAIVDLYARRVYALARSRLVSNGGRGGTGRGSGGGPGGRRGSSPFDQGHDAAEEVTQSVFATVAAKLGSGAYTEQGRFESWLFRVAMNRIRDEIRRLRRHAEPTDPEAFADVADDGVSDAARTVEANEDESVRQLRVAMEKLSDADREIVELRHHAGMSFKQMADMLNEPLGTLLARHHRALKKLKELITAGDPSLAPTGDQS